MLLPQFFDNPLIIRLSFHKLIERIEELALAGESYIGGDPAGLLKQIAEHPELNEGITDISQIKDNEQLISSLFAELFPKALSANEIKAVSIPYLGLIFNYSERFKNILKAAGPSFDINIRDFDDHQFYIASCCIILNRFYGTSLDFSKPLFYDIPTADGVIKHYRILYNADFLDIIPTESSVKLTPEDISQLLDNYENLKLWKEKFPPKSWIIKGFGIMTLVDVTVENAVSNLKSNLLGGATTPDFTQSMENIFRSIFKIPDMHMGFTSFDEGDGKFGSRVFGQKVRSFLLPDRKEQDGKVLLCDISYRHIMEEHSYFAVSDVKKFVEKNPDSVIGNRLLAQGAASFILAPVVKNDNLLGVLELVSPRINELNTVNARKMEVAMPFMVDSIDRKITEFETWIGAIIQNNYTTLHPSVNWKFRREAQNYIKSVGSGLLYTLKEIAFKDVYPLYGEVDIKDSSITRNLAVKSDLEFQVSELIELLEQLKQDNAVLVAEQVMFDLKAFLDDLTVSIKADTEQNIQHYLESHICPLLKQNEAFYVEDYFKHTDPLTGDFYINRRNYEKTLALVNEKLVGILDNRQNELQVYYPHYYERFKTDGVEHNLYAGTAISPGRTFEEADLRRLRMWQLLVTAEMEIEQFYLKEVLPYHLGVTSLILVFATPIAIRFRMDEKHFDIDGAYNIRYEVIKKRIDKAHIKGTEERITKEGTITVVYSKAEEEPEYRRYIEILQSNGLLSSEIESFDVEDLQGVSGLKALRVGLLYDIDRADLQKISYDAIYQQLNLLPEAAQA